MTSEGRPASPDPLGLGWKHDTPLAKTATPPPLDMGRATTPAQQAIERELAFYREWAGAPREPLLGCSVISHDRLGYCLTCTSVNGANVEIQGWRLLALREEAERDA